MLGVPELTLGQGIELACQESCGVWAERRRGLVNADFHWEWYDLAQKASRLAVVAPRDHAKSECFTVNLTSWRSTYRPGYWTFVFAHSETQAKGLVKRIWEAADETAPWLTYGKQRQSAADIVFANGSRVSCAGAGQPVRGSHPDLIIGDDVLSENATGTARNRQWTHDWWFGTVNGMVHPGSTRTVIANKKRIKVHFPASQVILVGTPFHKADLLMSMRENPVWTFVRYAAEFDTMDLVPGMRAVEYVM